MSFFSSNNTIDLGLFFLRLIFGTLFLVIHGFSKVFGGRIIKLSEMIGEAGYPAPIFFSYLVGWMEILGGLALILGIFVRFFSMTLAFTMLNAVIIHILLNHGFFSFYSAFIYVILFIALAIMGCGKYGIDYKIAERKAHA